MNLMTVLFGLDPVFAKVLQDLREFWNIADQARRDMGVLRETVFHSRIL